MGFDLDLEGHVLGNPAIAAGSGIGHEALGGARVRVRRVEERYRVVDETGEAHATHVLSLTPLKRVIRDYFVVCDTYYQAIRSAAPSQIEAIDMGRRGLHDEGSHLLRDRLAGKGLFSCSGYQSEA